MPNQYSFINDGIVTATGFTHDAVASAANFLVKGSSEIYGVCSDYSGNFYISDPNAHIILRVTPNGRVNLYGGAAGVSGNNGSTPVRQSASRFNYPRGLACDAYGNLYVADTTNNQIRKISPDGWVTLLAGDPDGNSGYVNGTSARFNTPTDLAVDASNNIYIADMNNNCIRFMKAGLQTVYTIAGTNAAGDVNGIGTVARFTSPVSICVDASGMCFIADLGIYKIKRMDASGRVYFHSGTGVKGNGSGAATTATYQYFQMITCDRSGNCYAIDFDEGVGARLLRINADGYSSIVYNFNAVASQPYVSGIEVNRSGKLFIVESLWCAESFNSSSSSSTSSSSNSSNSSSSTSSKSLSSVTSASSDTTSSSSLDSSSSSSMTTGDSQSSLSTNSSSSSTKSGSSLSSNSSSTSSTESTSSNE